MALEITRDDLIDSYSWRTTPGDSPKHRDSPDDVLVNRHEGYEVLDFINWMLARFNLERPADALKIEKMLHRAPSHLRSRAHIKEWIKENWKAH